MRRPEQLSAAVTAGTQVYHEVWDGGTFTGRRFTSLIQAQRYAAKRGPDAEVRASR